MEHSAVQVTGRHTIQSANLDVPEAIASVEFPFLLGPLDHLGSPIIPVGVVWVYESSSTCPKPVPIQTLKRALSRLLDYYPQLAGRLAIDSSNGLRCIHRQQTGIDLYESRCDASLSEFLDASTSDSSLAAGHVSRKSVELLAPWEPTEQSVQQNPLLRVQHTRFACGSTALGVQLARVMAGAGGFLQLFRHLAEIYRATSHGIKEPALGNPPHIIPFMADEMRRLYSPEETKAMAFPQPSGYSAEPIAEEPAPALQMTRQSGPVIGREIRFKAAELAALKEIATPPDGQSFVSTFSALSAHLWQRTQIARLKAHTAEEGNGDPSSQQCTFFTSVDFSSKSGLPKPYFPSAVITPSVKLSASDIVDAPLWRIAKGIYDTTRAISAKKVSDLANWVIAQPRKQDIRQTVAFGTNSLITTAWNKFSLFSGAELDSESSIACVPFTPTNLVDGLGFFLSPREDNGDIIVALALDQAVWEVLDKDVSFKNFDIKSV